MGERELSERRHALDRWQRTVLIVIGKGKPYPTLQHELRQMPGSLEAVLHGLLDKGLITRGPASQGATPAVVASPSREMRRYLTYLIEIVENADAAAALRLTIALKKSETAQAMLALEAQFAESLRHACGAEEAQRLLGKMPGLASA
jgi:hypothetical protein